MLGREGRTTTLLCLDATRYYGTDGISESVHLEHAASWSHDPVFSSFWLNGTQSINLSLRHCWSLSFPWVASLSISFLLLLVSLISMSGFKGHSNTRCEQGLFQSQCHSIFGPHPAVTWARRTAPLAWPFTCSVCHPVFWSSIWQALDLVVLFHCLLVLLVMVISLY